MQTAVSDTHAVVLDDGRVLILGGEVVSGTDPANPTTETTAIVQLYNPAADR
jgi:hypothetical protein